MMATLAPASDSALDIDEPNTPVPPVMTAVLFRKEKRVWISWFMIVEFVLKII